MKLPPILSRGAMADDTVYLILGQMGRHHFKGHMAMGDKEKTMSEQLQQSADYWRAFLGAIGQSGEAAQAGLTPFLMLMALISMNLAFINILPIPALDGGQIMVILIEMLLGKPLSIKTRMRIQSVGMFILLGLMAFLIINDILRVLS